MRARIDVGASFIRRSPSPSARTGRLGARRFCRERLRAILLVVDPARLGGAQLGQLVVYAGGVSRRRLAREKSKPVSLGFSIVLRLGSKVAAEIFDRRGRRAHRFLPRIEGLATPIEIFQVELRARDSFPCVDVVRLEGNDASA